MNIGDKFYRYEDWYYTNDCSIMLKTYYVYKLTPKGCWIIDENSYYQFQNYPEYFERNYKSEFNLIFRKFILTNAGKKFAWPTIEEARTSYLKRKERQIEILSHRLRRAEAFYKVAKEGKWEPETFRLEPTCLGDWNDFTKGEYGL